ncbi:MAG TPA: type II toxin-antitoxin system PemK/MazF family toxin [Acidimicrobiales bacterium]|nr:type II toxin-antitoxin system PemK/MazF family toxin [Acidimicrobiales bacterium]
MTSELPRRGELWWCDTEHHGRRPVVLLTRDAAIPRLGRSLAGLCTTTIRGLDSEVLLEPGEDPVPRLTAVNLDSVESIALTDLVERMGRLSYERMQQVCAALEVAVGCSSSA